MWIFKDSVKSNIDSRFCYSYLKKRDVYNNFHYKCDLNNFPIICDYNIIVWEFKDLNNAKLKESCINKNVNLDFVKFGSGETLNKRGDQEIKIKFGFAFNNIMNVNLDEYSKIERKFGGTNYKGFYGSVNRISLSNEKGEHQILLDYNKGLTQTLLLIYKGNKGFYLIIINSKKTFDESIINILNLS